MQKHPSDIVAWVNPTSPLQTGEEIRNVINYFIENQLDSLITVENKQVHCAYHGEPLNFSVEGLFAKTQDLTPVQLFVYSIMMWRTRTFLQNYEREGHALLSGKLGYYPVSKETAVIIKTDIDLMIAESVIKAKAGEQAYQVKYDALAPMGQ
jgi:CMP-N-acetylneuraminic acid synthetase